MGKFYTIDEVSKMFKIPKSTLRYWEDENLLKIKRCENSYRLYTRDDILQLCAICVYRNLDLSIKEIKQFYKMNFLQSEDLLRNNEILIQNKITELNNTLENVQNKLKNIDEVKNLLNKPYKKSTPPFNRIINFHPTDSEYINNFLKKQNDLSFIMTPETKQILEYGIIDIENTNSKKILWEKTDSSKEYVECILRVSIEDNTIDEILLKKHLTYIKSLNKNAGEIVAQYMIFSHDSHSYDYYKIWIELI